MSYRSSSYCSKRRVVRGLNARSFSVLEQTACRLALRVRSFVQVIERHVVRMYRTTCRLEKEQTTCRFSCQTTSRSGSSESVSSLIKTTPFWPEPRPTSSTIFLSSSSSASSSFLSRISLSLSSLSHPDRLSSSPLFLVDRRRPQRYSLSLSSFFFVYFLHFDIVWLDIKLKF